MSIIALMTDFGTRDYYVAAMKGVILQINPKVTLVDVSHDIGSQDLYHGAFVLRQAVPCFPAETVFVAVVDPTVGSSRRVLAARYNDRIVLAPDNGLLSLLHRDGKLQDLRVVENRRLFASAISSTFHGRDVFAPVAAHLTRGTPLESVGPTAERMEILDLARPQIHPDGTIHGEVMIVDHFGNLITNISAVDLGHVPPRRTPFVVTVGSIEIGPLCNTYADVPVGRPVALVGSAAMVEVAVNSGNASEILHVRRGDAVHLR